MMNKQNAILLVIVVAMFHFLVTRWIASQVGEQAGHAVAEMIKSSPTPTALESNYKKTKAEIQTTLNAYKPLLWVLSLPLGPMTDPIGQKLFKKYIYAPVINHELSREQARSRGFWLSNSKQTLNSVGFAIMVALGVSVLRKKANGKQQKYNA